MIAASIQPRSVEEARVLYEKAKSGGAHVVELRADHLSYGDLGLLKARPLQTILTVRPTWEGGAFAGDEGERVRMLARGCELGAEFVDVEWKAYKDFPRGKAQLIVSLHDFAGVPATLESTIGKMKQLEPTYVKVAVKPRSTRELLDLVALQGRDPLKVAVVPMGEYAEPMRAFYPRYGGPLMFASVGAATAPGQLSLADYAKEVTDETRLLAVVGNPIAHSKSPEYYNGKGVDARMARLKLDRAEELREAMAALQLYGCAVTIPHKEAVARLCGVAGAVNTVWLEDGELRGANTDVEGAKRAIYRALEDDQAEWGSKAVERRAVIFGAGGAARAFVAALQEFGIVVFLVNRTRARAEALARELHCEVADRAEGLDAQIFVNATPLGMAPDVEASPCGPDVFDSNSVAIDCVYTPPDTKFLRDARERGATTVSGEEMFAAQAEAQAALLLRGL